VTLSERQSIEVRHVLAADAAELKRGCAYAQMHLPERRLPASHQPTVFVVNITNGDARSAMTALPVFTRGNKMYRVIIPFQICICATALERARLVFLEHQTTRHIMDAHYFDLCLNITALAISALRMHPNPVMFDL
jgi:replication-associated recombination protein RarA